MSTSANAIYNHIIGNLKEAVEYLPWQGEGTYNAERVTKGFALGLLARVALFAGGWSVRDGNTFDNLQLEHNTSIPEMNGYFVGRPKNYQAYYQIALDACTELIADPENPHQLDPSYEDVWKKVNHLELNPYNENLFEVAFGEGQSGDVGATMGYTLGKGVINASRGMGGAGYASTTVYYFYSFGKTDKRRDVTLTFGRWRKENYEDFSLNATNVHYAKWRMYWTSETYRALHLAAAGRVATGINWIVMRYSDIYLMFAEAMNELYGPDHQNTTAGMTARQALEKVRSYVA